MSIDPGIRRTAAFSGTADRGGTEPGTGTAGRRASSCCRPPGATSVTALTKQRVQVVGELTSCAKIDNTPAFSGSPHGPSLAQSMSAVWISAGSTSYF